MLAAGRVSEYGDPDRQYGYAYDEVDGTGRGPMPALAVDRRKRPDYRFLSVARQRSCTSNAPIPGGTADASTASLSGLERRVVRLKRALRGLDAASERFDAWESCLSWVPVTEYGDPDGAFGYPHRCGLPAGAGHRPQRLGRPGLHVPGLRRQRPAGADVPQRTGRGGGLTCGSC